MKRQIGGLILAAIMAVCLALPLAASVQAATSATVWTSEECEKVNGEFLNGNCYAKPAEVDLSVTIGGVNRSSLSGYLAAAYRIAIGAAAVLAVVMIMIGGFRYIAAAGGKDISGAKGMIKNAIIGLVLTLLAFTLLQTVNPSIVNLDLPRAKMVKADYLKTLASKSASGMIGGPCYTIKDKDACAQACVTVGLTSASCECKVIPDTVWTTFAKAAVGISVGAVGAGVLQGTNFLISAKQGLAGLGSSGLKLASRIWQFTKKNPFGATATASGTAAFLGVVVASGQDDGELGICLPLALYSVEAGGTCFREENNCVKGANCMKINSDPPFGMCVTGEENTACTTEGENICKAGQCCPISYDIGTCQKDCSNRGTSTTCSKNDDCTSKHCVAIPDHYSDQQTGQLKCSPGTVGSFCGSDADCSGGLYCPTGLYSCLNTCAGYRECTNKVGRGEACCVTSECSSGLTCNGSRPTGGKCSVKTDGKTCENCGTCQ